MIAKNAGEAAAQIYYTIEMSARVMNCPRCNIPSDTRYVDKSCKRNICNDEEDSRFFTKMMCLNDACALNKTGFHFCSLCLVHLSSARAKRAHKISQRHVNNLRERIDAEDMRAREETAQVEQRKKRKVEKASIAATASDKNCDGPENEQDKGNKPEVAAESKVSAPICIL